MITCFYHNDMDGRCAAAIVNYFKCSKHPGVFKEVDYSKSLPTFVKEGTVYIVDYSFTEDTKPFLDSLLNNKSLRVIWIDHHTSSIELQEKYPYLKEVMGIRSDEGSGALLTWKYIMDQNAMARKTLPAFVEYVSDYDCWKFKFKETTNYFKIGVESIPDDALDPVWHDLITDFFGHTELETLDSVLYKGRNIKGYIDSTNTFYREHFAYESMIDGIRCMVVNWKTNSWVFGDLVSKYPITMVWVFDGTQYTYSIFSIDPSVNCSVIAEKFGGGGHRGAAGFKSTELLFKAL